MARAVEAQLFDIPLQKEEDVRLNEQMEATYSSSLPGNTQPSPLPLMLSPLPITPTNQDMNDDAKSELEEGEILSASDNTEEWFIIDED